VWLWLWQSSSTSVEAGSNTSTVTASRRRRRKGKSQIWDSKIWSRVPRDSDPRKTALAMASSMYKWQTRPIVREGAPQKKKQDRNCQTNKSTPRLTGWQIVSRNVTLTWVQGVQESWGFSCEVLASGQLKRKNLHYYGSLPGNVETSSVVTNICDNRYGD
jgi:hypothetical protein